MLNLSVIFCLALISSGQAWRLNVPRVLLPLADEGAKFMVFSDGGCFTWSSTRPEVVKVVPYNHQLDAKNEKNPVMPSQIEGLVQDVSGSGCTPAAIIHLPQHWSGSRSIAKVRNTQNQNVSFNKSCQL